MRTNNEKLSVLSNVLLTKMDYKPAGLLVVAGHRHEPFSCNMHCDGVCNRRLPGVTTSIAVYDAGEARITPALHRPSLLS